MRYVKKLVDPPEDDDQPQPERAMRLRWRAIPRPARVTRKMAKIDAELLAIVTGAADPCPSLRSTAPPPPAATMRLIAPPPLPLAFPFPFPVPFANAASTTTITTTSDDDFLEVRDSWLLPPPQEGHGRYRSLVPREPEPFTLRPPTYSMLPR